jgi:hypothetical protein
MNQAKLLLSATLFLGLLPAAHAGASGPAFTQEEIEASQERSLQIADTAASCLREQERIHLKFYQDHGYSKFFGNRNPKNKTPDNRMLVLLKILKPSLFSEADRAELEKRKILSLTDFLAYIRDVNTGVYQEVLRLKPQLARRERELVTSSCVGLALRCLGEGFKSAGMGSTWDKIWEHEKINNNFYGTDLLKALVDLGWTSLYWNPDPSQNAVWDQEDKKLNPLTEGRRWMPVWGQHADYYATAMSPRNPRYFGIPIEDSKTLVGFQKQPPMSFQNVPFFVGIAHGGYHVFPGTMGRVIEAHSMRSLNAKDNLEFSRFNPLDQESHGGPRWTNSEHYRSGVIVVPPGTLRRR